MANNITLIEPIRFQQGKSYHVRHPNGNFKPVKIHVDYVLENPTIDISDELPIPEELFNYKLIVYRVWIKHKKYWKFYVEPFWKFCLYNDWKEYGV